TAGDGAPGRRPGHPERLAAPVATAHLRPSPDCGGGGASRMTAPRSSPRTGTANHSTGCRSGVLTDPEPNRPRKSVDPSVWNFTEPSASLAYTLLRGLSPAGSFREQGTSVDLLRQSAKVPDPYDLIFPGTGLRAAVWTDAHRQDASLVAGDRPESRPGGQIDRRGAGEVA